jgi:fatty-acyl-CoA synthase
MTANILSNSMDDYPLTLTSVVERAERFHADREVVSRRPSGAVARTTLGHCASRARRLAGALAALGVGEGDAVATLLWNQSEHLELYFAVPAMGAVIHTLNPRLIPRGARLHCR